MKQFTEWLTDNNLNNDDSNSSLAEEQTTMMLQRFVGLLHDLPQDQKNAIIERAISDLKDLL